MKESKDDSMKSKSFSVCSETSVSDICECGHSSDIHSSINWRCLKKWCRCKDFKKSHSQNERNGCSAGKGVKELKYANTSQNVRTQEGESNNFQETQVENKENIIEKNISPSVSFNPLISQNARVWYQGVRHKMKCCYDEDKLMSALNGLRHELYKDVEAYIVDKAIDKCFPIVKNNKSEK